MTTQTPDTAHKMAVTLAIRCDDGSIHPHWIKTVPADSAREALSWALLNWHPAQGVRHENGGFYLNEYLVVRVGDGEWETVRQVVTRINTPVRRAA